MNRLKTALGPVVLENPILCTSGCFGYGYEAARFTDVSKIGAVSYKTFTLEPRVGNPPPRIHEIPSGVMTSIGLQNPGYEVYMRDIYPLAGRVLRPDQRFISIGGKSEEDYLLLAERLADDLDPKEIAALEINACCPNVSCGGGSFSKYPDALYGLLSKIVARVPFPVVAKISTMFENYCDTAKAVEDSGAQAVYTANGAMGMAIDIERAAPAIGNVRGAMSGPSIRPMGILTTWEIYKTVKIPIIASGGVCTWHDAVEYMMAGASAVGVGSASFSDPNTAVSVIEGLNSFVQCRELGSISDIVGVAHRSSVQSASGRGRTS